MESSLDFGASSSIEAMDAPPLDAEAVAIAPISLKEGTRNIAYSRLTATIGKMRERYGDDPEVLSRIAALRTGETPIYSGEDTVRRYLSEIGAYPLLTADEEKDLFQTLEAGIVAEDKADSLPQNADLPRELTDKIKDGLVAFGEIYVSNLRLVVSVAKRYTSRGLTFLDIIQEGNLGLERAVVRFDHNRGYKFSTYATWHIRQAIGRAIADKSRLIRLPAGMHEKFLRVHRVTRVLKDETDKDPTPEDIAKRAGMTVEEVIDIQSVEKPILSLSAPLGDDAVGLEDILGDKSIEALQFVDDISDRRELERIMKAAHLSLREKYVISLRFAVIMDELFGTELKVRAADGELKTINYDEIIKRAGNAKEGWFTLEEVGIEMGVTRERIRQLQGKALKKLSMAADRIRGSEEDVATT